MRRWPAGLMLAIVAAVTLAGGVQAQTLYASGWAGALMNPGTVVDFETDTRWAFGTSVVFGAGLGAHLGQGLMAGLDLSYSPARHEVFDRFTGVRLDEGRASIVTAMVSGRLGAGRAAGWGTYLAGGVGTMIYGIPHLDRWDADLALRGGGGVEFARSRDFLLFLEWHRWWVFHPGEGVQDNVVHHATLDLGARIRL
jgi:hypothetical protein